MCKIVCSQLKVDFQFKPWLSQGWECLVWSSVSMLDVGSEPQLLVSLDMTSEQPMPIMLSMLAVFDVFSLKVGLLGCEVIVKPGA